jgi:hypothetical protein
MVSQAQRAYLHIHEPEVAKEFEEATPKGKKLPYKKGKKSAALQEVLHTIKQAALIKQASRIINADVGLNQIIERMKLAKTKAKTAKA